ncbi:MAG: hypothetical protein ABIK28_24685 [Planctomycetota bacterium]
MKPVFSEWIKLTTLALCCLFAGCFFEADAIRFAEGTGVIPDPQGSEVAVHTRNGEWVVYNSAMERLMGFSSKSTPIWIEDENGRALLFQADDGLRKVLATSGRDSVLVIPDRNACPCQALDGSRALVAYVTEQSMIIGFSILDLRAGSLTVHKLENVPASALAASPDGSRISFAVGEKEASSIHILRLDASTNLFSLEWIIEDVRSPGHVGFPSGYWFPSGKAMIFWSSQGCMEKFDLLCGERHWISNSSFTPCRAEPLDLWFSRDSCLVIMEIMDKYGFRQVGRIVLDTAEESDITGGWIHHYSPVLSRDENYIAYRQGDDLPDGNASVTSKKESVYILDLRDGIGKLLCKRPFKPRNPDSGPAFSGDGSFVYYEKGGYIYKCFLKSL